MWILLILFSTTHAQNLPGYDPTCCCPPNGYWSEWKEITTCSDSCGGCGNVTRTRECRSAAFGCPCDNVAVREVRPCNIGVCYFPRLSCCPWLSSGVTAAGTFGCLPEVPPVPAGTPNISAVCTCCPVEGIWSEWTIISPCSDDCGSCGNITKTRTCLSSSYGCPCSGPKGAMVTEPCNYQVCLFPRLSCCLPYTKKIVNREFICGPIPVDPPIVQTTCCDPAGYGSWNPWQGWSSCPSTTCGQCQSATRIRTCGSEPYGCPCKGMSSQSRTCKGAPCTTGTPCCAPAVLAVGYDGNNICLDGPIPACTGTWTDWIWDDGASCSDICGNCGTVPAHRFCYPPGCTCSGPFKGPISCGNDPCLFPRLSCCVPFDKKIINGKMVCG